VKKTKAAIESKGHKATVVKDRAEALEAIKKLIPKGSSVLNGGSTTLGEIGFVDYLKGETPWNNLHTPILAEKDMGKQSELRRKAITAADYYLSSVSAVTVTGEFIACDLTGTRVGSFTHAASNVVLVVGSNKIVQDLEAARARQRDYCLPLESARVRIAYAAMGVKASQINNSLEITSGNPFAPPGRYHVILVNESLGY